MVVELSELLEGHQSVLKALRGGEFHFVSHGDAPICAVEDECPREALEFRCLWIGVSHIADQRVHLLSEIRVDEFSAGLSAGGLEFAGHDWHGVPV